MDHAEIVKIEDWGVVKQCLWYITIPCSDTMFSRPWPMDDHL